VVSIAAVVRTLLTRRLLNENPDLGPVETATNIDQGGPQASYGSSLAHGVLCPVSCSFGVRCRPLRVGDRTDDLKLYLDVLAEL
jgi:hypothetical protein